MRVLILSDIHSNHVALEMALRKAAVIGFDKVWNLGDTIGYGPRPNECMRTMRDLATVMIAGNHDLACLGAVNLSDFNPDARTANIWNGMQLELDHRQFLESLPPAMAVNDQVLVAHGSPRDPVWEYLLTPIQARENFEEFDQQVCFIGHSHAQLFLRKHPDGRIEGPLQPGQGMELHLRVGERYFINPGSIGQPRDGDPRSGWAILDTHAGKITFYRTEYDVHATQEQMEDVHLPLALIRRLQYGL